MELDKSSNVEEKSHNNEIDKISNNDFDVEKRSPQGANIDLMSELEMQLCNWMDQNAQKKVISKG